MIDAGEKVTAFVNAIMLEDMRLDQRGLEEHEAARPLSERKHRLRLICDKD